MVNAPYRRRTIVALALAALPGGCGVLRSVGLLPDAPAPPPPAPPPPAVYPLAVRVVADADINPDPSGRPSPLRLLVHADEQDPRVARRSFADVFGAGPGATASAGTQDVPPPLTALVIAPGQTERLARSRPASARWVTVSGAYREPWSAVWTATVEVAATGPVRLVARVGRTALSLEPERDP